MSSLTVNLNYSAPAFARVLPKRRLLAFAISGVFLFLLVALVLIYQNALKSHTPTLTIRKTELAVALPPPPPPQTVQRQQTSQEPVVDLTVSGQGAILSFSKQKARGDLSVDALEKPALNVATHDWNTSLQIDWNAFGLGDLDETPRLLSNIKVKFPRTLIQRGINSAKVELDVLIDETGKVLLKQVNRNPYPELDEAIKQLVGNARFTAPKKNAVVVRARFNWPVEFTNND